MTTHYSATVTIGSYTWSVEGNDTPRDAVASYGLASPLTIGQSWPTTDLQPNVQPEPAEASIPIIAPNAQTYPDLSIGDPVAVAFYSRAGQAGTPQLFYGRVATVESTPHDLGVLITVTALDYTADLREAQVGLNDWPAERVTDRVQRIMDEAQLSRFATLPPTSSDYPAVVARSRGAISAWDALIPVLDSWFVSGLTTDELLGNLFGDPSFSDATAASGWIANGGTTLAKTAFNATQVYFLGTKALGVTAATADNWGYWTPPAGLVLGRTYTFNVVVYTTTARTLRAIQYGANPVNGPSKACAAGSFNGLQVTWVCGSTTFLSVRDVTASPPVGIYLNGPVCQVGAGATQWEGPTGTGGKAMNQHPLHRPVVRANITAGLLDLTAPYVLETLDPGRHIAAAPPGRLTTAAGVVSATFDAADSSPSTGSTIIDAGTVDWQPTFTQVKGGGVANRWVITTKHGQTTWDLNLRLANLRTRSALAASIDTDLTDVPANIDPDGGLLIQVYAPDFLPDPRAQWTVKTLTWQAWASADGWAIPPLGSVLTIARANVTKTPTNRPWLNGIVAGWQLVVAGGRPVVRIDIAPNTNSARLSAMQLGAAIGPARFESPIVAGVTIAQLNTRDSWADYALVRGI